MKTSPDDVFNKEVMKELKKLSLETEGIKKLSLETREELKKLSLETKEIRKLSLETKEDLQKLSSKVDSNQTEVLEAVQGLAEHTDDEFLKVRTEMKGELQSEIGKVRAVMVTKEELQSEMSKQRMTMVTKGYLDDKFADFHSDLVRHTRKEIEKAIR